MSGEASSPPPASPPRSEYPRPQLVRRDWLNLNGSWEFDFDDADTGLAEGWHHGRRLAQQITVPFPYQSALSGIGVRAIHEVVWYARDVAVPPEWGVGEDGRCVLLHFGAVDYRTTVWLNGDEVGHNRGGHVPFSFDVTPYLRPGPNRLAVRVEDRQDAHQPRGKQSVDGAAHGIDYFCTTGIWQSVWLEPVPAVRIDHLQITPLEDDALDVGIFLHAPSTGWNVEVELHDADGVVAHRLVESAGAVAWARLAVPPDRIRRWTPDSPHLYDLAIRLLHRGAELDAVASYAALRTFAVRGGRFVLNGEPTYLRLVLDQGYWPDGLLAAPSDEALQADVTWAKRLGFNGARKHQKIEDPRWLYWCDRLGLLVWADMANARAWSPQAEETLLAEWERVVRRDYNHPCIVAWVPVNESMGLPQLEAGHPGQYAFLERAVAATRRLDPYRPVVDNDGWEHTDVTDVCAIHDYTPDASGLRARYAVTLGGGPLPPTVWYREKPLFARGARYRGQPVVLSEVGGFLTPPPDLPPEQRDRLYQFYVTAEAGQNLLDRLRDLLEGIAALPFVAGFCYTQLTDLEQEVNGLLTYDRRPKVDAARLADLQLALFRNRLPLPPNQP